MADKGYISKKLFQKLFVDGIQLITKLKSNMKGALRHRSVCNFAANLLGAVAAYCYFPKKPSIQVVRVFDNQLTLF